MKWYESFGRQFKSDRAYQHETPTLIGWGFFTTAGGGCLSAKSRMRECLVKASCRRDPPHINARFMRNGRATNASLPTGMLEISSVLKMSRSVDLCHSLVQFGAISPKWGMSID